VTAISDILQLAIAISDIKNLVTALSDMLETYIGYF
jgi:hypothetical protein